MNFFRKAYCRTYQKILACASYLIPFPEPTLVEGEGAIYQVVSLLKKKEKYHPLIVAGPTVSSLGMQKPLIESLNDEGLSFSFFDRVLPNPTFAMVEEAYKIYKDEGCDSIIALGGGSSVDAAKAIGVKAVHPNKSLSSFKRVLSVGKKIPFFVAIPTTAGTGSEATACAVVVNEKTHDKFSITDTHLIPDVAVLDSSLLIGLPKKTIAATGMDTLTHAIEAYIGRSSTRKTNEYALTAIKLVKDNLVDFYEDSHNDKARRNMQKAAYLAGVSFTRAYVGYVHALAHALGGLYNVSHGFANAVLLPYVLEAYGESAYDRLAEICDDLSLVDPLSEKEDKAKAVIAWIKEMNKTMGIPSRFENLIKNEADLEALSRHADKEGNPFYPVPKELNKEELKAIYLKADETK